MPLLFPLMIIFFDLALTFLIIKGLILSNSCPLFLKIIFYGNIIYILQKKYKKYIKAFFQNIPFLSG